MDTETEWTVPDDAETARREEAALLNELLKIRIVRARLEEIWHKFDPDEHGIEGPDWKRKRAVVGQWPNAGSGNADPS